MCCCARETDAATVTPCPTAQSIRLNLQKIPVLCVILPRCPSLPNVPGFTVTIGCLPEAWDAVLHFDRAQPREGIWPKDRRASSGSRQGAGRAGAVAVAALVARFLHDLARHAKDRRNNADRDRIAEVQRRDL